MANPAAKERAALAEALRGVSPDAPTLCEGWTARDLATHLVVRDSRPDLMAGQKLPVVGGRARAALRKLQQTDYPALVDRVAAGPRWSPARVRAVDTITNPVEFYVHTEDVLRAQPGFDPRSRRTITADVQGRLWTQGVRGLFLFGARAQHQRVTFLSPAYGAVTRGRAHDPLRVIEGPPEELVLWAFGRRQVAAVDVTTP